LSFYTKQVREFYSTLPMVANAPHWIRLFFSLSKELYNPVVSEYNTLRFNSSEIRCAEKCRDESGSSDDRYDACYDDALHLLARLSSLCQELLTPAQMALSRAAGAVFCLAIRTECGAT